MSYSKMKLLDKHFKEADQHIKTIQRERRKLNAKLKTIKRELEELQAEQDKEAELEAKAAAI